MKRTIRIYDGYTTNTLLCGLIFIHCLYLSLDVFFTYRYLTIEHDPTFFVLLGFMVGLLAICDILIYRAQVFSRVLVKCKFTESGIACHGLGVKKWTVKWSDICFYGIYGYSLRNQPYGIIYLSTDSNEKFDKRFFAQINHKRIIFQDREVVWKLFAEYMPTDIYGNLLKDFETKSDCFHRRKVQRDG